MLSPLIMKYHLIKIFKRLEELMIIKIKRILNFERTMLLIHYYQLSDACYIDPIIHKAYEDKFCTINIISIYNNQSNYQNTYLIFIKSFILIKHV